MSQLNKIIKTLNFTLKETECKQPPTLDNSVSHVQFVGPDGFYLPYTKVFHTCFDGYIMAPQSYEGVICLENGNYSAFGTDRLVTTGECVPSKY